MCFSVGDGSGGGGDRGSNGGGDSGDGSGYVPAVARAAAALWKRLEARADRRGQLGMG